MTQQVKEKFSLPDELKISFIIPKEGAQPKPHHLGIVYKLATSKNSLDKIHS